MAPEMNPSAKQMIICRSTAKIHNATEWTWYTSFDLVRTVRATTLKSAIGMPVDLPAIDLPERSAGPTTRPAARFRNYEFVIVQSHVGNGKQLAHLNVKRTRFRSKGLL